MTALPMPEPGRCTCRPVLVARFVREALVGLEYRHQRSQGCTRPSEPVDVMTWRTPCVLSVEGVRLGVPLGEGGGVRLVCTRTDHKHDAR